MPRTFSEHRADVALDRARHDAAWWVFPAALIGLATTLRFIGLGSQLWHDEISALNSIRRPALEILTVWPGASSHVLYELLAHAGYTAFGESAFGIRLPAALFGVLGVAVFLRFATRWLDGATAWFGTGLFAVSYHHIFFSQNARGYTALIALALASTLVLARWRPGELPHRRERGLYVVLAALTAFASPFGVFVPVGHALVVLGAWIHARLRNREAPPLGAYLVTFAATGVVIALLYVPFVPSMIALARMNIATPAEGPRLSVALIVEVVEGLGAATRGLTGLLLAAACGAVGAAVWLRRAPVVLALLLAPLVVQAVVFAVLGVGIHPRYFAIALPIALLIGAQGVATVAASVLPRLIPAGSSRRVVLAAGLTIVVVLSAMPLRSYYRIPKQDYLGAIEKLNQLVDTGGRAVAISMAGNAMNGYYRAGFLQANDLEALRAIERGGGPLYLATTMERILGVADPAMTRHIRQHYRIVAVLPGSVGDAAVRIYAQAESTP